MILSITEIGDPILRMKMKSINLKVLGQYQKFFDNMIETLEIAGGVGLAAPQVMSEDRIFIVWLKPTKNHPELPNNGPEVVVNPQIIEKSDSFIEGREGCLSIPGSTVTTGLKGKVLRHEWIGVEYYTRYGKKVTKRITGFEAVVFQHEYDHLQGIMFLDRMKTLESLCTYEWFEKNK